MANENTKQDMSDVGKVLFAIEFKKHPVTGYCLYYMPPNTHAISTPFSTNMVSPEHKDFSIISKFVLKLKNCVVYSLFAVAPSPLCWGIFAVFVFGVVLSDISNVVLILHYLVKLSGCFGSGTHLFCSDRSKYTPFCHCLLNNR